MFPILGTFAYSDFNGDISEWDTFATSSMASRVILLGRAASGKIPKAFKASSGVKDIQLHV